MIQANFRHRTKFSLLLHHFCLLLMIEYYWNLNKKSSTTQPRDRGKKNWNILIWCLLNGHAWIGWLAKLKLGGVSTNRWWLNDDDHDDYNARYRVGTDRLENIFGQCSPLFLALLGHEHGAHSGGIESLLFLLLRFLHPKHRLFAQKDSRSSSVVLRRWSKGKLSLSHTHTPLTKWSKNGMEKARKKQQNYRIVSKKRTRRKLNLLSISREFVFSREPSLLWPRFRA